MADLRDLIEAHWAELTPNQQRVGEYALSNPFLVATMGIEDLAEAAAVSAATITRFVRQLGLKNYAEFRAIAVRRYQDLLRPIDNVSRAQQASSAELTEAALASAHDNLDGLSQLLPGQCDALVDRMAGARQVGLLGFGSSALCLTYLRGLTEGFLRNQVLLDGSGGHERMARIIGRMGPGDLLIAMALPRYSIATVEFLRLARASGVPCIGITDRAQSPICPLCDETILLPAAHPVLNSSALAGFGLFELVGALFTARYQSPSEATAMTRLIFPYLYTDEDSSQTPPEDSR
ncbi:MurR/RpiR family transcriptional regulator [Paracoccus seriniphilus]|uniref:Transcriptional regulator, RpiR family n=1 Tax=Paracoccus seriniphilus TaxID=184748 RepID=A0A239PTX0_9RHOB|nr:MurR/RpiR family transcriptional regulator [Paracoccus seriniphilus]WCR16537.1 MurR/RpiR family transcriptional regulator [Paracoccus seriniphilus]SNT73749.1 transcriptional regulator, RpiR family [Paracoccus seriniphilus]